MKDRIQWHDHTVGRLVDNASKPPVHASELYPLYSRPPGDNFRRRLVPSLNALEDKVLRSLYSSLGKSNVTNGVAFFADRLFFKHNGRPATRKGEKNDNDYHNI